MWMICDGLEAQMVVCRVADAQPWRFLLPVISCLGHLPLVHQHSSQGTIRRCCCRCPSTSTRAENLASFQALSDLAHGPSSEAHPPSRGEKSQREVNHRAGSQTPLLPQIELLIPWPYSSRAQMLSALNSVQMSQRVHCLASHKAVKKVALGLRNDWNDVVQQAIDGQWQQKDGFSDGPCRAFFVREASAEVAPHRSEHS
jgi:hypothetical protein